MRRCFLDDKYSDPSVKSSGSATIPDVVFHSGPADEKYNGSPLVITWYDD